MTKSTQRKVKVACRKCGKRLGFIVGPAPLPAGDGVAFYRHDIWWADIGLSATNALGEDIVINSADFAWRPAWWCKCGANPQYRLAKLGTMWESGEPIAL